MKRIAAIATSLCVCAALAIWLTRKQPPKPESPNHEPFQQAISKPSPTPSPSPTISWELSDICVHEDALSYRGFRVTRFFDHRREEHVVTISKRKRVLARHTMEDMVWPESSCFGLYPVLGRKDRQLVIVRSSGGAHCCFDYRIYDFSPGLRLVFDSSKYPIGDGFDELKFQDLDGDGIMEFTQRVMTFDYCCNLAYVSSPQPTIAFKYDSSAGRFALEVRRFNKHLLKDAANDLKEFEEDPLSNWSLLLRVVMQRIYVGEEKEAWRLWARGGEKSDRAYVKLTGKKPSKSDPTRSEITKLMRADPIYRLIYHLR